MAAPSNRAVYSQGEGQFFLKSDFTYLSKVDAYRCPVGELLPHKTISTKNRRHLYARSGCNRRALQSQCTKADKRLVTRHFNEEALVKADQTATVELMMRRMAIVEPPFGTLSAT